MTEMEILEDYLKKQGIQYERIIGGSRNQIIVHRDGKRDWDAICHPGSYGYEQGLLEVMGDRVVRESDLDRVCGFLTAQQVIDRLNGK